MKNHYTSAFKARLVRELLKEQQSLSQLAAEHKVHPNQLRHWRAQVVQDLPSLFDKKQQSAAAQSAHEQQTEELYAQLGRLTTQVGWRKKNLAATLTRPARAALVERAGAVLPRTRQAELLSRSRSSLSYRAVVPKPAEVQLKHRIDERYTAHPFYGSRRLAVLLRRDGHEISRRPVQRYMREMSTVFIMG